MFSLQVEWPGSSTIGRSPLIQNKLYSSNQSKKLTNLPATLSSPIEQQYLHPLHLLKEPEASGGAGIPWHVLQLWILVG